MSWVLRFRLREHLDTALWPVPCLAPRRLDLEDHRDHDGRVRFTAETPRWEDYVSLAVDEIRTLGMQQVQIVRRLRAMLEDLLQLAPAQRKDPIRHELDLLAQAVERTFSDAEDRARARG
jgi:uncharacterized membrane protein